VSDVVIGGSGFIGRNLAGRLERAGREVVVIDRHPDATGVFGGRFIEGDAQDADWLAQTLGGLKVEDLYHLAANSDISAGVADASLDFGDTLMTTAAVHYALTRIPVQRLVFASSSAIFGVSDAPLSEVHDRAPAPVSWYGKAKLASEYVLESLASARYDLPILIVRFPNVVGPLATHGVVFDFVRRLRDDPTRLDVLGDGHQTKPYVHVSALLDGIDYFLDRSGPGVTRVNIGPPDQVDVRTIAQEVCACLGVEPAITFQESPFGWPGDVPRYAFDTSRMRAAGFDLQTSSRAAVRRAAEELALEWPAR